MLKIIHYQISVKNKLSTVPTVEQNLTLLHAYPTSKMHLTIKRYTIKLIFQQLN